MGQGKRGFVVVLAPLSARATEIMNKSDLRLLLVEDVPADAELIQYELRRANISFEAKCVASRRAFLNELRSQSCDAIISDFSMPQFNRWTHCTC